MKKREIKLQDKQAEKVKKQAKLLSVESEQEDGSGSGYDSWSG